MTMGQNTNADINNMKITYTLEYVLSGFNSNVSIPDSIVSLKILGLNNLSRIRIKLVSNAKINPITKYDFSNLNKTNKIEWYAR